MRRVNAAFLIFIMILLITPSTYADPEFIYKVYGSSVNNGGNDHDFTNDPDYAFLGESTSTDTFTGTYDYYTIATEPGNMAAIDAIEGSNAQFFAPVSDFNVLYAYDNLGASDEPGQDYAFFGHSSGGEDPSHVVIDAGETGITSITVYAEQNSIFFIGSMQVRHREYESGGSKNELYFNIKNGLGEHVTSDDFVTSVTLYGPDSNPVDMTSITFQSYEYMDNEYEADIGEWDWDEAFFDISDFRAEILETLIPGTYQLEVTASNGQTLVYYKNYTGEVSLSFIPASSCNTRFDSQNNLFISWEVPDVLFLQSHNYQTFQSHYINIMDNQQLVACVGIKMPTHLEKCYIPNELLQEIRSKGDAFYYSIQVRKCDYTDRAISTSIPLEIPFAVNITSPNGNEVLATGDTYDITWETNAASNEILYVELSYSTNDGDTWDLIAMQPGNSGTYEWEIPTFTKNMTNCRIKLQAFDSNLKRLGIDKSDNPFTIEVMKVTSPDGEDSLISGDMHSITWMSNSTKDPVDKVKIKFTKNGGKTWETVANVIGNPEEYVWTVPDVPKTKNQCRVKAVQKDSAGNTVGKATSEGYFTIEPKP